MTDYTTKLSLDECAKRLARQAELTPKQKPARRWLVRKIDTGDYRVETKSLSAAGETLRPSLVMVQYFTARLRLTLAEGATRFRLSWRPRVYHLLLVLYAIFALAWTVGDLLRLRPINGEFFFTHGISLAIALVLLYLTEGPARANHKELTAHLAELLEGREIEPEEAE